MTYRCKDCGSTVRGRHSFHITAGQTTPEETALLEPLISKFGVGLDHGIPARQIVGLTRLFWKQCVGELHVTGKQPLLRGRH